MFGKKGAPMGNKNAAGHGHKGHFHGGALAAVGKRLAVIGGVGYGALYATNTLFNSRDAAVYKAYKPLDNSGR